MVNKPEDYGLAAYPKEPVKGLCVCGGSPGKGGKCHQCPIKVSKTEHGEVFSFVPGGPGPLRLDIGCGTQKREGFIGVDSRPFDGVDVVLDMCARLAVNSANPSKPHGIYQMCRGKTTRSMKSIART